MEDKRKLKKAERIMDSIQNGTENRIYLLEAELEQIQQEAFMDGYKYAIAVLQDAIPKNQKE